MAWYSYLNPIHDIGLLEGQKTVPGAAGAAKLDPSLVGTLVQNADGTWSSPAAPGQRFTDNSGQVPVGTPTTANAAANDAAMATQFNGQLPQDRGVIQGALTGQGQLAASLNNTINNPSSPSVAGTQLGIGLDANDRQQLSLAGGATGANSFLAARNAANNINQANLATNQARALTRAGEVATAQGQLGSVFNNIGGEGQGLYSTDTGTGLSYNRATGDLAAGREGLNASSTDLENKNKQKVAADASNVGGSLASAFGLGL